MTTFRVNADGMYPYGSIRPIPLGQVEFSNVQFLFSHEWDGLERIVQFVQGDAIYNQAIGADGICTVPSELQLGPVTVYVKGYRAGEAMIATANGIGMSVVQGAPSGGTPPVPPGPDLYAQLLKKVQDGDQEILAKLAEYALKNDIPAVPNWAMQPQKPGYTATEVGADPAGTADETVNAHNTQSDTHADIRLLIQQLTQRLNTVANSDDVSLDQLSEIVAYIKSNKDLIDQITTNKVSVTDIINNLVTNVPDKPLSAAMGVELKRLIDAITVPAALSDLTEDAQHRTVTDEEKKAWDSKQPAGDYITGAELQTIIKNTELATIDKICPLFHQISSVVQGELVEGYPLHVISHITPWQEGSGDPSPTNVRPIHGARELSMTVCGENLFDTNHLIRSTAGATFEFRYTGEVNMELRSNVDNCYVLTAIVNENDNVMNYKTKAEITAVYKSVTWLYNGTESAETVKKLSKIIPPQQKLWIVMTPKWNDDISGYVSIGGEPMAYDYHGETHTKKLPEEVFNAAFNWGDGTLQLRSKLFTLRIADMNNSENQPGWKQVPGLKDVIGTELSIPVKTLCSVGRISTNAKYSILFFNNSGMTQSQWQAQYPDMTVQILVGYLENLRPTIQLPPEPHILAGDGITTLYGNTGDTEVIGRELPSAAHDELQAQIDDLKNAIISAGGKI